MKKMSKLQLIYVSLLLVTSFSSFAQMGIGTEASDASAALDITSTTGGFLLPRMTLKQIHTIKTKTPAEGLMVYCTNCSTKGIFVNNGTKFINIVNGNSMDIDFDTSTKVVDVISSTGKTWMDRNLGAAQAATSSTDADSYGDLYQWGRGKDGHEKRGSETKSEIATTADAGHGDFITAGSGTSYNWTTFSGANTLWQSGLNDPCPVGYRIPTESELDDERAKFNPQNAAGALSSVLKLPAAGYRHGGNGTPYESGSIGYYWSSSLSLNQLYTDYLRITSTSTSTTYSYRFHSFSVRCIKKDDAVNAEIAAIAAIITAANNPAADGTPSLDDLRAVGLENVILDQPAYQIAYEEAIAEASPAPTRLGELQAIINAVNIRDITTLVLDVTSSTGKTWMDRNLGAAQAATSSTDADSYGDLYQWGRGKDGHEKRGSETKSEIATTADAGHGDFITAGSGTSYNWTTFSGANTLWQSGLNDPCPVGYRIPTRTELEDELATFDLPRNKNSALSSVLKLPTAGYRNIAGNINNQGITSGYWSSTEKESTNKVYFLFISSESKMFDYEPAVGFSVRCIKKE